VSLGQERPPQPPWQEANFFGLPLIAVINMKTKKNEDKMFVGFWPNRRDGNAVIAITQVGKLNSSSNLLNNTKLLTEMRRWISLLQLSTAGVLNPFPVNYPRVIEQSTQTPRLASKAVDFSLLHHNNARSGKIYAEFSIGTHFPPVWDIKK